MKEIYLKDFLKSHTQNEAAAIIGCTQGAINQMISNGRDVRIEIHSNGSRSAYEVKQLNRKTA